MAAFPYGQLLQTAAGVGQGVAEIASSTALFNKKDRARRDKLQNQINSGQTLSDSARRSVTLQGAQDQGQVLRALDAGQVGSGLTGQVAGQAVAQASQARSEAVQASNRVTSAQLAEARARSELAAREEVDRLNQAERDRKAGIRSGVVKTLTGGVVSLGGAITEREKRTEEAKKATDLFHGDIAAEYADDPEFQAALGPLLADLQATNPRTAADIRARLGILRN
jgi:hypothetical protein